MDTILWIVLLTVGTLVFVMVNKIFDIWYFGFKGMFGTWMACVLATGVIGVIAASFIAMYYKWIIGGFVVLALLVYFGTKSEQNKPVENNNSEVMEEKDGTVAATITEAETGASDKNEFDVILTSAGVNKINVVAVVRAVTGVDLIAAKALADGAPKVIKEKVAKSVADEIKAKLEEAGAIVEVR